MTAVPRSISRKRQYTSQTLYLTSRFFRDFVVYLVLAAIRASAASQRECRIKTRPLHEGHGHADSEVVDCECWSGLDDGG